MRWRVETVAPVRPRSSWLRKLSLTPAVVAIALRVWRRRRRAPRKRRPTSASEALASLRTTEETLQQPRWLVKRPRGGRRGGTRSKLISAEGWDAGLDASCG